MDSHVVPYRVLVIDDAEGASGFGQVTRAELELHEFEVVHATSWEQAEEALEAQSFDFFMVDVNLQGHQDGLRVLAQLRERGYSQPIAVMTGNDDNLSEPIRNYTSALASGPVSFVDKNASDTLAVARDMSNRVDGFRRALRLMSEAGLGEEAIVVDGTTLSVAELLRPSKAHRQLERALRESLSTLMLRIAGKDGR